MLTLPSKFVDHIQGADTQLTPLVIIGTFGVDIPDPLRGVKLATCMLRKGWSTDIVGKWARELVGI